MRVIPLREHPTGHTKDPLHGPRHPRPDRLHPATQRRLVLGFHQEMNVVMLNAVMDKTKLAPLASLPKAPAKLANESPIAHPR
jgi:hypothetical protein